MRFIIIFFGFFQTVFANASAPVGLTHMLPSPFTLPVGRLSYGTSVAFGITDFLQVGTDLYRLIYNVPNASMKLGLWQKDPIAVAATFSWMKYDLKNSAGAKIADVTSLRPGIVTSFLILDEIAWSNGATFDIQSIQGTNTGATIPATIQGTVYQSELSWLYSKNGALAGGVSYDTTYELFGFGLSHHWRGFQLGFHYYPKADEQKILPILTGGGSVQF